MNRVTAIILGGGRGTRLMPLTAQRAKPAVSFAGKYRLIDIPISNCINSGIRRQFVLTQFLSASLHRHIMKTYQFDNFTDGFIDILAAEQTTQRSDWFQGTADAVRATLRHTGFFESDQKLILPGDHLYRMNYADLVRFHRESEADLTISVHPVPASEAHELGVLRVDANGYVTDYMEKPQNEADIARFTECPAWAERHLPESSGNRCLASMGIYVFESEVLERLLEQEEDADFGSDVVPRALEQCRVRAYPFTGYWRDIGTISSFYDANIALAQPEPPFRLYEPGWPIYTHARSLPPNRIIRSKIQDSLLAQGTEIIGAEIHDSIIGMRGIIGAGTVLRDVMMLGADFYEGEELYTQVRRPVEGAPPLGIGHDCNIERAIIDKNARIGNNVTIGPQSSEACIATPTHYVRDGITIVPKDAVVPDGTVI